LRTINSSITNIAICDSDDPESPPKVININSISIEEISDPVPPSGKGKETSKLDFPLGL